MSTKDATFYVQIEPEFSRWNVDKNGDSILQSIKAVALTQKRPDRPRPGVVVAKLTVRVPDGAFMPLRPEVIVTVPEGMVTTHPIEVEAGDAAS
jgi:hypothetical protein